MEPLNMLEQIERYHRNEMSPEELAAFEAERKKDPELDQMTVEHHFFISQLESYSDRKRFKANLHDIHHNLQENGEIRSVQPNTRATVVAIWKRYRRVVSFAAAVAGVTALLTSGLTAAFSPKVAIREVEELRRKVNHLEKQTSNQRAEINAVRQKIDPALPVTIGGTSFIIDPKGYLITSAHVVEGARNIYVQHNDGHDYKARLVMSDRKRDLALLQIDDDDFKPGSPLPYGFNTRGTELAEPVFTLGYPKDEIVYGEGYLSARSGLKGDTLAYQISINANPGNSGGPILNRKGEVVGILNARQTEAEGVVFAVRARNIVRFVDEVKAMDTDVQVKIPTQSSLRNLDRVQQVRKIQDCVYMVKVVI
ncbi:MAG: trypsin-like peptidase domain-containing protein [Chitinophagaceae bacterium]|jgi:serine protease Do|nr:trypsin-like peptidase domain-containing protein [Chitinophagaceae bacterium]